jgi:hypothetical protein
MRCRSNPFTADVSGEQDATKYMRGSSAEGSFGRGSEWRKFRCDRPLQEVIGNHWKRRLRAGTRVVECLGEWGFDLLIGGFGPPSGAEGYRFKSCRGYFSNPFFGCHLRRSRPTDGCPKSTPDLRNVPRDEESRRTARPNHILTYRKHKSSGQGVVMLTGALSGGRKDEQPGNPSGDRPLHGRAPPGSRPPLGSDAAPHGSA